MLKKKKLYEGMRDERCTSTKYTTGKIIVKIHSSDMTFMVYVWPHVCTFEGTCSL